MLLMTKYFYQKLKPIAVCFLLFAFYVSNSQAQSNKGPMLLAENMQKVSDNVYVISDGNVPGVPNVGIIVGSKSTLIVDTGLGKANGLIVFDQAKKVSGNNQLYLVTTHIHPEHDLGAHAFPESTQLIRAQAQVDEINEQGQRVADIFRSRSDAMRDLLEGATFRKADTIFSDNYALNLGGVEVSLLAMGPNHTPGDTAIYVKTDRVLFSGDIAMQALPSFVSSTSSVKHWLSSLEQLKSLPSNIIVPSHGPMGNVDLINQYQQYLTQISQRSSALKTQGKSLEETIAVLTTELEKNYGKSPRIAGAIRAGYAEAK